MPIEPGPELLRDWVARAAQRHPAKPWVVSADDGRTITYRELHEAAGRIATCLHSRGIGTNHRVALLANNSIEHLLCYFGVMSYGATICTVHVEMNRNQLDNIFARLKPMLVLHQDGLGLDDLLSRVAAPSMRLGRFDRPDPGTFYAEVAGHEPNHPQTSAGPDDDAVILFTSGTSARPKGVVLNYREHLDNIDPAAEGFGITADDRVYDFRSFNWASAQLLGALVPVNRGATLVMTAKFSASRFFHHIRDHRVTVAAGNPTTINILLNTATDAQRDNLPSLRFITSSSAPLTIEEWRRFEARFGIPIAQGYGSSETGWIAASPGAQRRSGTVGRPFAYHRLAVVDADGRPLPPGEIGQVEIGGNASHEYRYLADDGSVKVSSRGRIRTGDLGFLDADGFLQPDRAREGPHHSRRRQHLADRDRQLPDAAPRADRGRHRRRAGRDLRRGGGELRGGAAGRIGRYRRAPALLQRRAAGVQGAQADRAQCLAAEDRARQAQPACAGGAVAKGNAE